MIKEIIKYLEAGGIKRHLLSPAVKDLSRIISCQYIMYIIKYSLRKEFSVTAQSSFIPLTWSQLAGNVFSCQALLPQQTSKTQSKAVQSSKMFIFDKLNVTLGSRKIYIPELYQRSSHLSEAVSTIFQSIETCGFNYYKLLSMCIIKNDRKHKVVCLYLTEMTQKLYFKESINLESLAVY